MATQPRRRSTRRERRGGATRPYTPVTTAGGAGPRAVYQPEAQVDRATEFMYIRKDMIRILVWATILIGLMVVLSFLPLAEWLPFL